ncbi:response regulator [Nodosilinea sp. FACHB-131]|nr:response regulator [Nodosilinea sp. FACHB-131]
MGELMRSLDWSQTPVGSAQSWSQSLKSLVKTLLTSRYPMVLTWGAEFTQFYNDAYSQVIGDKHPAALGTDIRETLAEAWDTLGPMIQRVMATGVANWTPALPLVLERAGYREESYFSVSHAPAEDDEGQIVGMLAVCSEVTQQVLGERRLRLLRDLAAQAGETRSVQDTCQDLMTAIAAHALDVPFALLYLRESEGRTLTLQGTVGLTVDDQLCPHSIDLATDSATRHPLWSFAPAAAGETVLVEALDHHMTVPGGPWNEPVHTALMMPIASSSQTAPLGVLVAGVNPNRALDEGYRSFYELLVGQVSVSIRNAQAYEEERRRAEMLAELDRAKTAFFSNVSHEFRTPLTLMLNPLEEVLQSNQLPPAEREQITLAQRNAQRLLKLVNTLLDFSRIEAGRAQTRFEPTDLATYTVELTSLFQSAIEQAGLRLILDCPALPQPVAVDRDMWEKIVLNLLSNAVKFTFEGEITVSLHAVGDQVELVVRDTGLGIPEAELPRLFERFHRVEGARGRTFEGTGIGLSLVQELVHLHQGTIAVKSTLGQGSTFRVQLPINSTLVVPTQSVGAASALEIHYPDTQAQPTDGATPYVQEASSWLRGNDRVDAPSSPLSPSSSASSPARIFLIDDNADMRNYLHRVLGEFYQVEVFTDGLAGLNAALASTPDLVLSDVMMPGMDGFELLKQLRHNPQTREIPILLLSARAGEEAAVEGLSAGADDYLVKPFSARELLARVAANVELGRARQAAARHRFDRVLSSISDFIYTFDLAGRFTYANQPLLDLWQKPLADIVGKTFSDLDYPPELADRLQQQIQQVITTRQSLTDETSYTSASGTRVYEYIFVPLLDAGGAVEAVAGTGRDISDRKQAEAIITTDLENTRLLRDLSARLIVEDNIQVLYDEIMAAAITLTRADAGTVQLIDNATQELVLLASQGFDQTVTDHFDRVNASSNTSCGLALLGGTRAFIDFDMPECADPCGALRVHVNAGYCSAQSTPLLSRSGRPIGMVSTHWRQHHRPTARELRFLDLLARQAADLLEQRQTEAERGQVLEREQAARKEAERANRIKDEFLAVLSHELRSPLNPILGWTQLLQTGKLTPARQMEALATIERNAKLQSQLIEDLLDISRIMQGKLTLTAAPINLAFVIAAAVETVQLAATAKNIQITLDLDPNVAPVSGDAARLQQVVWNLLTNAVKFTDYGGQVTVQLRQVTAEGSLSRAMAQIRVIDTGKGISPQFLPHVFEYFRQEDGSTTRKFGGLGLGLAIVRQIVELHGGTVAAESSGEHQGATFIVRLPALQQATPNLPKQNQPQSASETRLDNVQILLVEDDTDTREFQTFLLEQHGATVTAVASGVEALRALEQFIPDVMVSDIGMAEMDGYGLMQQIRSRLPAQGGTVPAIALTAYAADIDQRRALEVGFQTHLTKPLEPERFVSEIVTLLKPKRV